MTETLRLRPAIDPDKPFLYRLRCATMRAFLEPIWGWDESWQRNWFEENFPVHRVLIAELGSQPVGTVWLSSTDTETYIAELQVVPEFQGRGIGTRVLHNIIAEAARTGLPVALAVFDSNPRAQRLYERLGFKVIAREAPYIRMQRD
jgi:ribosomal protein S18 acetylase RimI-like enzyme